MQRIAKTSPGVLDLSAVKDEFGLPVTLNGVSHRDVPDHELNNPVLQRVLGMQWVTVTRLPVEAVDTPDDLNPTEASNAIEAEIPEPSPEPGMTPESAASPASPVTDSTPNAATKLDSEPEVAPELTASPASPVTNSTLSAATKPDRRSSRRA